MLKQEHVRRRKQLMETMGNGSIAIIPTSTIHIRNRDVEFPFRADSDFYYLTGFAEPEAVAVLVPHRPQGEYILFCRERDPERETWDGLRAGLDGATVTYGADDAFPFSDMDDILPGLLENKSRVYYTMGLDAEFDQRVVGWVRAVRGRGRAGVRAPEEFIALGHILHDMRLYKSKGEIAAMRQAAQITVEAHRRAMRICHPGLYEYQVEAELQHAFMHGGARSTAYPPIVGGGANGCILHYRENADVLQDGDLLLIDAGAEFDCYAADVTRTFPVNGRFTPAQREAYEVVLEAQLAAIDKAVPGNHWNEPHEAAVRVITKGLIEMGILKGKLPALLKAEAYKPYYMHRTGHWLGMDVHDVGDYKVGGQWRVFEPGMVLTVEPGLYFKGGTRGLAKRWWNIGIRIEDDVLISKSGNEVLTVEAPKTVDQIESLMSLSRAA